LQTQDYFEHMTHKTRTYDHFKNQDQVEHMTQNTIENYTYDQIIISPQNTNSRDLKEVKMKKKNEKFVR